MFPACRSGIVLIGLLSTWGCREANRFEPSPPPTVQVAVPLIENVTNYLEETGSTEAVEKVEVRARVRGFIDAVCFEPFTDVQAGDVLYQIEPRQYEAAVASAEAALAASHVGVDRTKIEYDRQQLMFKQNATPERNLVAAKADYDGALAQVQAAEARLDRAKLDLDYTQVKAPISGRVSKTLIKRGNLVDGNEATHLTTIINYDRIYANFFISERQLLTMGQGSDREALKQSPTEEAKQAVKLYLARETDMGFPFEGHFDFADLAVDQSTGTYLLRGIFDNPEKLILPGLFVKIRIPIAELPNAKLVPEYVLSSDQTGKYILIVNDKDVVERRDVVLGVKESLGVSAFVVIREGIGEDDRVVVNGLQRARPGATVAPEWVDLRQFVQQATDEKHAGEEITSGDEASNES